MYVILNILWIKAKKKPEMKPPILINAIIIEIAKVVATGGTTIPTDIMTAVNPSINPIPTIVDPIAKLVKLFPLIKNIYPIA